MSQPVFKVLMMSGVRVPTPAQGFFFTVQEERFKFAVHKAVDHVDTLSVSHWNSGQGLLLIGVAEQLTYTGDGGEVGLAVAALERLVAKHGPARVRSVLAGAA